MTKQEKNQALLTLHEQCRLCRGCELHSTRTNVVFGKGDPDSPLLFVGEAPGEKEDLSGLPFVGAAGKLLDHYLQYIGLKTEQVYIANILKCRPPKNRDPLPAEEEACLPYLWEQVKIIHPKVLVCLGRISAMKLIKPDFRITAEHGQWFLKNGVKIMAVYHPAALLRDPRKKEDMVRDFETIAEELKKM